MSLKYRVKLISSGGYVGTPIGKIVNAVEDEHGNYLVDGKELPEEYFFQECCDWIFMPEEVEVMEIEGGGV